MPFTPAHPAVLLPARLFPKKYISWTALLIGSMVPDMEYFLFMTPASRISHTLYGILNFNLPVTLLLAMAWHQFAGPIILRAIPFAKSFYTTLHQDYAGWLAKNWHIFLGSAMIGILSHLFLDGLCHREGFLVQRIPYLQQPAPVLGIYIYRCYALWYFLSFAGLIIMTFATIDFKKLADKYSWLQVWSMRGFILRVIFVALAIACVRILFGLKWNVVRHLIMILLGSFLYSGIAVTFYERYMRKVSR